MKDEVSREYNWFKSACTISTDCSKAVLLLQFFYVRL